eukprot:6339016-Amphidinium_carterae.1
MTTTANRPLNQQLSNTALNDVIGRGLIKTQFLNAFSRFYRRPSEARQDLGSTSLCLAAQCLRMSAEVDAPDRRL